MLAPLDVDEFARILLAGQPAFPRYFADMRPTNQAGPRSLGGRIPEPRAMRIDEVRTALGGGALLVDLRSPKAHALAHAPGSVSIPADASFGTWLGWVVERDRPIVLLLEDPRDWDDAIRQSLRIGHDAVDGYLGGGFPAWIEAGLPVESNGRVSVDELAQRLRASDAPLLLDVRQTTEFAEGHIPGAVHLFAGNLQDRLATLPRDRPIVTICASGYRSSVASSLLRSAGFGDVSSVSSGFPAWEGLGYAVERGEQRISNPVRT
jgi:hydroxyacylglutathione hydrolase